MLMVEIVLEYFIYAMALYLVFKLGVALWARWALVFLLFALLVIKISLDAGWLSLL
ncbi:MAG: hypothetical protein L3J39_14730 [Verrucomicrobiales bacterium]|nr:hypothetical protein [Verrucomicrobiales bacterium]